MFKVSFKLEEELSFGHNPFICEPDGVNLDLLTWTIRWDLQVNLNCVKLD